VIHNTIGTYRRFSSNKTAADIVQWDYGSWPDGLPKKDGANALSGAGSLDTATTRLSKTSRTKNLIIEYHELGAHYFDERRRHYTVDRLAQRIERLGYRVHLEPVATTAA